MRPAPAPRAHASACRAAGQRLGRCGAATLALAAALQAAPAAAGQACTQQALSPAALAQGMALAQRSADALQASGAQVVVLARAGQDLARYGLRWSHLGFAYRGSAAAAWRVLHKLNHCGSAEAALYRQGLGEFFLDQPHRYEAIFVPLAPALAAQLLPLLQDNAAAARLHERRYSLVAYPWATRYQQSNQWVLEMLAMAADGAASRRQAQGWLQARDYQPTLLHLGPLQRLGARAGSANVAFDDHPGGQRLAGRINTTSADSVLHWLPRAGLGGPAVAVP